MLAKQTSTLMKHMKKTEDNLVEKIESLKEEFAAMKTKVDNIENDLDNTKQRMNAMEQNIENELEERIQKTNQIFIRGAKTKESAGKAIEIATGGRISLRWIRAIKRKDSNQNDDPIGYVAKLQNKEEKINAKRSRKPQRIS